MTAFDLAQHTLFVCSLCRFSATEADPEGGADGQQLINHLEQALQTAEWRDSLRLQPVRCMAACSQSCTAVLAAPDKLTFVLHELAPLESVQELVQFCGQYVACADGRVPYHARSQTIKQKTSFILPPLPSPSLVEITVPG